MQGAGAGGELGRAAAWEDVTFGVYHAFDERRLWGSNPRPWD